MATQVTAIHLGLVPGEFPQGPRSKALQEHFGGCSLLSIDAQKVRPALKLSFPCLQDDPGARATPRVGDEVHQRGGALLRGPQHPHHHV